MADTLKKPKKVEIPRLETPKSAGRKARTTLELERRLDEARRANARAMGGTLRDRGTKKKKKKKKKMRTTGVNQ